MSQCSADRFTIVKGSDNTFSFTIKQTGSIEPMVIEVGDSFTAKLVKLEDETVALTKTADVVDTLSGKISVAISSAETTNLVSSKGEAVDRYYVRPTYKLVLECTTTNNGDFVATVRNVYVD